MHERGGKDGRPVSPRTVEFARAVLRRAMNDAVVGRLIEVNPVVGSKAPRKDGKPQHVTWTGGSAQAFLEAGLTPGWRRCGSWRWRQGCGVGS